MDSKCKGFTLIEVLMVIVVIGILAAILLPALMRAQGKAKDRRAGSDISSLESAILAYRLEYQCWPVNEPDPTKDANETYTQNAEIVMKLTNATPCLLNLSSMQLDASGNVIDPWKHPYVISVDKNYDGSIVNGVAAFSLGANGVWGTDDIAGKR